MNHKLIILVILACLVLPVSAISVGAYIGDTAYVFNGITPVGTVQLLNPVHSNGTTLFFDDCDLFTCRVRLNVTSFVNFTFDTTTKPKGTVAGSRLNKTGYDTTKIYEARPRNFTESILSIRLANRTTTSNATGENTTTFYNETYISGTQVVTRNVTEWYSLPPGVSIHSGQSMIIALDYSRTDKNDVADLVPNLFGLSFDGWAWWNTSFGYKERIDITNWNCSAAFCQFPIPLSFNSSLSNGSDIRVLNSNESVLLNFWRDDDWNYTNASGILWVNASNQTNLIFVYYNSSGAGDASNVNTTFIFGDDFDHPMDWSKWTSGDQSSYTTANGLLRMGSAYPVNLFAQKSFSSPNVVRFVSDNARDKDYLCVINTTWADTGMICAYPSTTDWIGRGTTPLNPPIKQRGDDGSARIFEKVFIENNGSAINYVVKNATAKGNATLSAPFNNTGTIQMFNAQGSDFGLVDNIIVTAYNLTTPSYTFSYSFLPYVTNVSIQPDFPNITSSLNCSAIPISATQPTFNLSFVWYKNGVLQAYNGTALNCANNTLCYTNTLVPYSALTINDNWSCSAQAFDGSLFSSWSSSINKTIAGVIPSINTTIYPPAPNQTSVLNCSAVPVSVAFTSLNVSFSWFKNGTLLALNSTISCSNNTLCWNNVTVSSLSSLSNYTCSAQAFDGYNYSSWANATVTISDILKPNISFVSPTQNTTAISRNGWIAVNVSCSDDAPYPPTINVTLYLNGSLLYTNASTLGTYFINYSGLVNGNYSWNASCTDTSGNWNNTETRTTAVNTTIYSPVVLIPAASTAYSGVINISYTDASWPNGTTTSYFNLTLMNTTGGVVKTITGNVSTNLSYLWNSVGVANGFYQIRVRAYNNLGQTADGNSSVFFLENILLANCSGNNTVLVSNFSIIDENTLAPANANVSINYAECLVGYANSCHSNLIIIYNVGNFSFCANDTATRSVNLTIVTTSGNGQQRTTALANQLWNNTPVTNYTLFVDAAARWVAINVINGLGQGVASATVDIYRSLNATLTLVASSMTDGSGHTGNFLTANTIAYTFNITSPTTAPFSTSQVIACDPNIATCSVTFVIGQTNITQVYPTCQFNTNLDAVAISDLSVTSQSNLPVTVWFNVSSSTNSIGYAGCRMTRLWNGTSNTSYCGLVNDTTHNMSVNCSCVINDPGQYYFYTWYANQGCIEYRPFVRVYTIASNTTGGLLSGIASWNQNAPVSGWVFYFAGVVIAMLVGGFISRFTIDGAGIVAWLVLAGWSVLWLDAPVLPALGLLGTAASLTLVTGLVTGAAVYYHYTGG